MQRAKLVIIGLVASVGLAFAVSAAGQAKLPSGVQTSDRVVVAAGQVHEGSLYAAGEKVVVEGTVTGDLYCAGRELILTGTVEGDVLCSVQVATINGTVGQDVRLVGQYVNINNAVAGSVTFFGQDIKLFGDGSIGGDLNGAAQHIMLSGPVGRSVLIASQNLTLQSTVGGNVDAAIERVDMIGGAQVAGNFNYRASSELTVDESAVGGAISFTPASDQKNSGALKFIVVFLATIVACALVLILLAPRFVARSARRATENPLMVALVGFVVVAGTPLLVVASMMSVVLMPLGIMALALLAATIIASQAFFAYFLGTLALRRQHNILVRGLAGVALLFVLYLIPVLNAFVAVASTVFGAGMVVSTTLHGYRRPRYSLSATTQPKPLKKETRKKTSQIVHSVL